MNYMEMSEYQLHSLKTAAEAELNRRMNERASRVRERLDEGNAFGDEELIYAAHKRCKCGAGMAYPKGIGMHGFWECSDLLTQRVQLGETVHTERLSFAAYEIPNEKMRSMGGASTRPVTTGGA